LSALRNAILACGKHGSRLGLFSPLVVSADSCKSDLMTLPYDRDALRGRVAVVAGATRGAGRGIAAALGEAGATVICTGRTSSLRRLESDYDRSETIEETAELVTKLGGIGIAVPIDHLVPDEVKGLAKRLQNDFGKIDILVNDIWGAELL